MSLLRFLVLYQRRPQKTVTRARMTQLVTFLNLAPRVQEALLLGDLHLSERRMRAVVARAEWEGQRG